jgi:hypothetical protein
MVVKVLLAPVGSSWMPAPAAEVIVPELVIELCVLSTSMAAVTPPLTEPALTMVLGPPKTKMARVPPSWEVIVPVLVLVTEPPACS